MSWRRRPGDFIASHRCEAADADSECGLRLLSSSDVFNRVQARVLVAAASAWYHAVFKECRPGALPSDIYIVLRRLHPRARPAVGWRATSAVAGPGVAPWWGVGLLERRGEKRASFAAQMGGRSFWLRAVHAPNCA